MTTSKILFVVPPSDPDALRFAEDLKAALSNKWDIAITDANVRALRFETRKYDLIHFFTTPATKAKKPGGKTKAVQTILGRPSDKENFQKLIFADEIVTFSDSSRKIVAARLENASVKVIPPCVALSDPTRLDPPSEVRARYEVGDRMMVLALNDARSQKEYDSFLYIVRELNRREVFRFLMPIYTKEKSSNSWREKLQYSIGMEKLTLSTILGGNEDLHSLIDASDFALYIRRDSEEAFEFPTRVVEALLRGKPVLTFAHSPVSEIIRKFNAKWVVSNTEDFVRESRDLQKEEAKLEETSTELARFARARFEPGAVAAEYEAVYNRLLSEAALHK